MTDIPEELVERVARALAKANRIEVCDGASYRHSSFREPALAAIRAVLEWQGEEWVKVERVE